MSPVALDKRRGVGEKKMYDLFIRHTLQELKEISQMLSRRRGNCKHVADWFATTGEHFRVWHLIEKF
jgi:hypothetical protein